MRISYAFLRTQSHLLHILLPGARATAAGSGDSVVGLDVLSSNCLAWALSAACKIKLINIGTENEKAVIYWLKDAKEGAPDAFLARISAHLATFLRIYAHLYRICSPQHFCVHRGTHFFAFDAHLRTPHAHSAGGGPRT